MDKFGIKIFNNNNNNNRRNRNNNNNNNSYRIVDIDAPCVIYNEITSERIWDFIIYPYHPKQKQGRCRPLRYVVLKDDAKLNDIPVVKDKDNNKGNKGGGKGGKGNKNRNNNNNKEVINCNGAHDLWQFIYCLLYSYTFSIPFPTGPTSQPGPIKYAKHYAESFSQMILKTDKNLNDLKINERLQTRPIITTRLLDLPDLRSFVNKIKEVEDDEKDIEEYIEPATIEGIESQYGYGNDDNIINIGGNDNNNNNNNKDKDDDDSVIVSTIGDKTEREESVTSGGGGGGGSVNISNKSNEPLSEMKSPSETPQNENISDMRSAANDGGKKKKNKRRKKNKKGGGN